MPFLYDFLANIRRQEYLAVVTLPNPAIDSIGRTQHNAVFSALDLQWHCNGVRFDTSIERSASFMVENVANPLPSALPNRDTSMREILAKAV